jgi:NAD+ diphosphatase
MEVAKGAQSHDMLRAYHGAQWKGQTRFCGKCGSPNGDAPDEFARLCPACGKREYPRLSPAVIVLVTDEADRILLAHNQKFKNRMYSLLAGFVEMGESLESAIYREIQEEVGILVREPRYVASQPWPFPDSLMIGFRAKAAGGPLYPDGKEILDAQWFSRDALPEIPGQGSLSRFLIDQWLAEADAEALR